MASPHHFTEIIDNPIDSVAVKRSSNALVATHVLCQFQHRLPVGGDKQNLLCQTKLPCSRDDIHSLRATGYLDTGIGLVAT